jgi:alpha-L-fucosidase
LSVRGKDLEPHGQKPLGRGGFGNGCPTRLPEETDRMMQRHRDQLVELLTNYGKIDMICLDMWFGPTIWPKLRETMLELRKIQPDVMFRARGIGNYGDYYTPEGFVPGDQENTNVPWFVIYPLGRHFSYEQSILPNTKAPNGLLKTSSIVRRKEAILWWELAPTETAQFHPVAEGVSLRQTGRWLKINGEGVYATRARDANSWKDRAKK